MVKIVTNNPYVRDRFKNKEVEYIDSDVDYLEVLLRVRDLLHNNYKLLTHPLSGSIKPNETPYKSVLVEKGRDVDFDGIKIIESSIETFKKFQNVEKTPNWLDHVRDDFMVIDLDLMVNTIEKLGH